MGWEGRARGGRYYTRSKRIAGRVVREYIGTGEAAEAMADVDSLEREQRRQEALEWQRERARYGAVDAALAAFCQACDEVLERELMAAGYHRHHRGEWRRRRDGRDEQGRDEQGTAHGGTDGDGRGRDI